VAIVIDRNGHLQRRYRFNLYKHRLGRWSGMEEGEFWPGARVILIGAQERSHTWVWNLKATASTPSLV
jgi:hypothetical protein